MTLRLSPIYTGQQFFNQAGEPLSGGTLSAYQAGSFTELLPTYTTSDGQVENSNPIVFDSAGRLTTSLWLEEAAYNLVVRDSTGTVISFVDEVWGTIAQLPVNTTSAVWQAVTEAPSYVSPTQFQLTGNFLTEFDLGNRVLALQSGNLIAGTVSAVSVAGPVTDVTIAWDSAVLNSTVEAVFWSALTRQRPTVDAGAVSWTESDAYTVGNTVGRTIRELQAGLDVDGTRLASIRTIWPTTGTGGVYVISPTPAFIAGDQIFTVRFTAPHSGTASINGLNLVQYSASGAKEPVSITAGLVSDVGFDGTDLVLLDALPGAAVVAPRGWQPFTSSGTFTTPSGVFFLKITCVGGGGGGGPNNIGFDESFLVGNTGGGGGGGAAAITYISTTPGTSYSVTVAAGGAPGANGGTSSFGISLCSAGGGSGTTNINGGVGGVTGTGLVFAGEPGSAGYSTINGALFTLPSARPGAAGAGLGGASRDYGSGGLGGTPTVPAQAGRPGLVLVEW